MQKTFWSLSRFSPAACTQGTKVFWFFFSKKNRFPSFEPRQVPLKETWYKEKIAAYVALAMVSPIAGQAVITTLCRQGGIIGDNQHHGRLEADHVEPAGFVELIPILSELPGEIAGPW